MCFVIVMRLAQSGREHQGAVWSSPFGTCGEVLWGPELSKERGRGRLITGTMTNPMPREVESWIPTGHLRLRFISGPGHVPGLASGEEDVGSSGDRSGA